MRGPKVMIAVVILAILGTMGYALILNGRVSMANAASEKSPSSVRMMERAMSEADQAMGRQ